MIADGFFRNPPTRKRPVSLIMYNFKNERAAHSIIAARLKEHRRKHV